MAPTKKKTKNAVPKNNEEKMDNNNKDIAAMFNALILEREDEFFIADFFLF